MLDHPLPDSPTTRDQMTQRETHLLIDRLFRSQRGRLIASIVRIFGTGRLDMAESVVQDAFLKACRDWPSKGIPANPTGWLVTVARNGAIDMLRSEKRVAASETEIAVWHPGQSQIEDGWDETYDPTFLDDQLRLMFACCHPSLTPKAQIGLTLKIACGFSVPEIARNLLTSPEATRKLIYRAKRTLRERQVPFEWPLADELPSRVQAVLDTLYVIFNEGYGAPGEQRLGEAFCDEAIRLCSLFVHPAFDDLADRPRVYALLALMLLQSSRMAARISEDGRLVLLADQDRTKWDRLRIALGLTWLRKAAVGDTVSRYHLEAQIAACHATATDFESTDWAQIVAIYDALMQRASNPVVALNRAVAIGMLEGPRAGLAAIEPLSSSPVLRGYHLLPAAAADFQRRLHRFSDAARLYAEAIDLAHSPAEIRFLQDRLAECTAA